MKIAIVNHYQERVSDDDAARITEAIGVQMFADVAPHWGSVAATDVSMYYHPLDVPPDWSIIAIVQQSDVLGALAYHGPLDPRGKPFAYVGVDDVLASGGDVLASSNSVATAAGHEAIEMVVDPDCNIWIPLPSMPGKSTAKEACDFDQNAYYTKSIGGVSVAVTNFALPEFFDVGASGPRDYMKRCWTPLSRLDGGYLSIRDDATLEVTFDPPQRTLPVGKNHPAARPFRRGHR